MVSNERNYPPQNPSSPIAVATFLNPLLPTLAARNTRVMPPMGLEHHSYCPRQNVSFILSAIVQFPRASATLHGSLYIVLYFFDVYFLTNAIREAFWGVPFLRFMYNDMYNFMYKIMYNFRSRVYTFLYKPVYKICTRTTFCTFFNTMSCK